MALAAVLGYASPDRMSTLLLASLMLATGGVLNVAFRATPGPLATYWQACRQWSDPGLYRVYSQAGPWAWRLGLGGLLGLATSTLSVAT